MNNVTRIHTTPVPTHRRTCPDWCDSTMCTTDEDGLTFHMATLKAPLLMDSPSMDGPQLHPHVLNDLADVHALVDDLDMFTDLRRAYNTDTAA